MVNLRNLDNHLFITITHPYFFLGMVGDVNLYWNDYDEPNTAEIEVMVAEKESRRKGLAQEALTLFMAYATTELVSQWYYMLQNMDDS